MSSDEGAIMTGADNPGFNHEENPLPPPPPPPPTAASSAGSFQQASPVQPGDNRKSSAAGWIPLVLGGLAMLVAYGVFASRPNEETRQLDEMWASLGDLMTGFGYFVLAVGVILVVVGLVMLRGSSTGPNRAGPTASVATSTTVAPAVAVRQSVSRRLTAAAVIQIYEGLIFLMRSNQTYSGDFPLIVPVSMFRYDTRLLSIFGAVLIWLAVRCLRAQGGGRTWVMIVQGFLLIQSLYSIARYQFFDDTSRMFAGPVLFAVALFLALTGGDRQTERGQRLMGFIQVRKSRDD